MSVSESVNQRWLPRGQVPAVAVCMRSGHVASWRAVADTVGCLDTRCLPCMHACLAELCMRMPCMQPSQGCACATHVAPSCNIRLPYTCVHLRCLRGCWCGDTAKPVSVQRPSRSAAAPAVPRHARSRHAPSGWHALLALRCPHQQQRQATRPLHAHHPHAHWPPLPPLLCRRTRCPHALTAPACCRAAAAAAARRRPLLPLLGWCLRRRPLLLLCWCAGEGLLAAAHTTPPSCLMASA